MRQSQLPACRDTNVAHLHPQALHDRMIPMGGDIHALRDRTVVSDADARQ